MVSGGPGADHMQGWLAFSHGSSEGLAVQGDDISRDLLPNVPDPGQKTFSEGFGIKQEEDPVEGVGTGNTDR